MSVCVSVREWTAFGFHGSPAIPTNHSAVFTYGALSSGILIAAGRRRSGWDRRMRLKVTIQAAAGWLAAVLRLHRPGFPVTPAEARLGHASLAYCTSAGVGPCFTCICETVQAAAQRSRASSGRPEGFCLKSLMFPFWSLVLIRLSISGQWFPTSFRLSSWSSGIAWSQWGHLGAPAGEAGADRSPHASRSGCVLEGNQHPHPAQQASLAMRQSETASSRA